MSYTWSYKISYTKIIRNDLTSNNLNKMYLRANIWHQSSNERLANCSRLTAEFTLKQLFDDVIK